MLQAELKEPLPEALWLRRGAAPLAERAREAQRRDAGGDAPELRAAPRVAVEALELVRVCRERSKELVAPSLARRLLRGAGAVAL